MELVDRLKKKNILIREIPKWANFLQKQWEDNFADHLTTAEKKDIYLWSHDGCCGYLWHVFSYEKRSCLKGQEAEKAFNDGPKKSCYIFWQDTDQALILENADQLTTKDLEDEYDIYVVDKEYNWTYVKTHETGICGPYFSRKDE